MTDAKNLSIFITNRAFKKDSRGRSIVFTFSHDIVQSIDREPFPSLKQLSDGMVVANNNAMSTP